MDFIIYYYYYFCPTLLTTSMLINEIDNNNNNMSSFCVALNVHVDAPFEKYKISLLNIYMEL